MVLRCRSLAGTQGTPAVKEKAALHTAARAVHDRKQLTWTTVSLVRKPRICKKLSGLTVGTCQLMSLFHTF